MIRAVIDTNVIVSGLLKPLSKPGLVLDMMFEGMIDAVVSRDILDEYKRVICYGKFNFSQERIKDALIILEKTVLELPFPEAGMPGVPWDDAAFAAAAIAAGADYLITGNIRHFPQRKYGKCRVVTPAEFLHLRKNY